MTTLKITFLRVAILQIQMRAYSSLTNQVLAGMLEELIAKWSPVILEQINSLITLLVIVAILLVNHEVILELILELNQCYLPKPVSQCLIWKCLICVFKLEV